MRTHTIVTSRLNPFVLSSLPQLRRWPDPPAPAEGGGTPPAPPAAAPVTPPAPAPGHAANGQFTQDHLNERIGQAKRSAAADLLKELGVSDVEAAKKTLAKAKDLEEAQKSELQRKDEELTKATAKGAEAEAYRTILTDRANRELATMPEAAQASIKALAGDDPIKLLATIDLAKAMAPTQAPGVAPGAAAKPPVPPAANTTAAAGGPPSAYGSPPDLEAEWRTMQTTNPLAAAHFFLANQQAIVSQRQKQT